MSIDFYLNHSLDATKKSLNASDRATTLSDAIRHSHAKNIHVADCRNDLK